MVSPLTAPPRQSASPGHKDLPHTDGSIVENFQEHPQGNLLTESLTPRLRELFPDGQFAIGHDSGIYWRLTDPPLDGCKSPDWFLVLGVPPMLDGEIRRSYVLWQEVVKPLLVVEIVSRDGSEEHDATPYRGKFWVYEKAISAAYYAIFDAKRSSLELFQLRDGQYELVPANAVGRHSVAPLRVDLGIRRSTYRGMTCNWLRLWDSRTGELLSLAEERADIVESLLDEARERLDEETQRAERERKRAADAQRQADEEKQRAANAQRQADEEKKRAANAQRQADDANREAQSLLEKNVKLLEKLRAAGIDPAA